LLVKVPGPDPSVVFELAVVGFWVVAQHTPRAVTAEPPSDVILPPLVAVVGVIAEAAVVERVGAIAVVVKVT
jgi:hypothetical protein